MFPAAQQVCPSDLTTPLVRESVLFVRIPADVSLLRCPADNMLFLARNGQLVQISRDQVEASLGQALGSRVITPAIQAIPGMPGQVRPGALTARPRGFLSLAGQNVNGTRPVTDTFPELAGRQVTVVQRRAATLVPAR